MMHARKHSKGACSSGPVLAMLDGEQDGASGVSCMARKEILGKGKHIFG